ncbi:MAG: alpha/beta fold hydrolase [Flavisolibacter sp.]
MSTYLETDYRPEKTGYAPIIGLNLYYEIHGKGHPLVLIHGGGSTIQTSFGSILPSLAENFQVIALELQGHGHTSDRDAPESFEQDAEDVAALLHYLRIEKAHIFGFSNGANTAMRLAINHSNLVHKLILASGFYKREGMIKGFFEGMEKATLDDMPAIYQKAYLQITNNPAGLQTMFEKDRDRMIQFRDWPDTDLFAITAPTLLIVGDKDVMTTEHTVEMSRKIAKSELLVLPGYHGSYMGEAMTLQKDSQIPALTLGVIKEFLEKNS